MKRRLRKEYVEHIAHLDARVVLQRRRLRQLEDIVARHAEHYRMPLQHAADAARNHIVAWQEQYFRANAAEKELKAALERNNVLLDQLGMARLELGSLRLRLGLDTPEGEEPLNRYEALGNLREMLKRAGR